MVYFDHIFGIVKLQNPLSSTPFDPTAGTTRYEMMGICPRYTRGVSQALIEPPHLPPATEEQVRAHAADLIALAAEHGISELAFASPGRLRGHILEGHDPFAPFSFERAATQLLGAEVEVFSDEVLRNEHVGPDLVVATRL